MTQKSKSKLLNNTKFPEKPCTICNSDHEYFKDEKFQFIFPVFCDHCLSDLKEIILEKRGKNTTNTNLELIGMQADRLDSIIASITHKHLPFDIHMEQLPEVLKSISDNLKQAVIQETGNNPWAQDNEFKIPPPGSLNLSFSNEEPSKIITGTGTATSITGTGGQSSVSYKKDNPSSFTTQ